MRIPLPDVRRIRLVWIGRLGDLLLATPFFAAARARFPKARITLITGDKGQAVARLCPDLDEVLVLRPFHSPLSNLKLALALAREEDDLFIDLNTAHSRASAILAALARSKMKLAFCRGRADRLYDAVLPAPSDTEHMLDRYARLAEALGAPYDPRLRLRFSPEDLAAAKALLAGFPAAPGALRVLLHPGNFKKFDNRWPEEKFIALTDGLLARPDVSLAYLAGPGEEAPVRAVVDALQRPVPILGPLSVGTTAALLSLVDLVVVNATGTAHLAAAVGTPTFTILGRYTQTVWMPRPGTGHFSVVSDSWKSCREISVGAAASALDDALRTLRSRRTPR